MSEKMFRSLVTDVNKLLGTNYNMISFDSLSQNALLQICANCLTKLDVLPQVDFERNTEDSITKMLDILHNIKLPELLRININDFTNGIIRGKRAVVHLVLLWILNNQKEVIKRSYFSKYLKKIPILPAILSDPDIQQIINQYDHLIQEFKSIHLENAKYAKTGQTTMELRKEIEKISNGNLKVMAQIEKQKSKVENIPNKESLLISIKSFRYEVSQQKTWEKQIGEQVILIAQLESQTRKYNQILNNKQALRLSSNGVVAKLKEEIQTMKLITQDRLPKEYEAMKKQSELIEIVAIEPQPTQFDTNEIERAIDNMTLDLQKLVEKALIDNDPRNDKLAQFRQHANVIANSKQIAADSLMDAKETVTLLRRKVEEKENELQQTIGGIMPQGDELKRFVSQLRGKSVIYKERRSQLLEIQAELGVLYRTQDILQQENVNLIEALANRNNDLQEQEEIIADNLQVLCKTCQNLAIDINTKNADTTLLRQKLLNIKSDHEQLSKKYEQAKEIYNSSVQSFIEEIKNAEEEINDIQQKIKLAEEKWKEIKKDLEHKEDISEKLQTELQSRSGKKSQIDIINEKIHGEEDLKKQLDTEVTKTKAEKEHREQQMVLWNSALEILKCKKNCM